MTSNKQTGQAGEQLAVDFLRTRGMTIIERNWRTGHKEVDIIAADRQMIVFVEVKTRATPPPTYSQLITRNKMRFLASAARTFLKLNALYCELRFDVVLLVGSQKRGFLITYVPNAFRGYGLI